MTADDRRANFLAALSRAQGVQLTSFESSFLGSNLDRFNFSDKARRAVDRMIAKYAIQIKFDGADTSLAAKAEQENKRIAAIARVTERVVVGGKTVLRPKRQPAIAVYRPKV